MNTNMGLVKPNSSTGLATVQAQSESTRKMAEIQSAMTIAKASPRDIIQANYDIVEACKLPMLAETALYSYKRGKKPNGQDNYVTGASIRLAEMLVQNWGNVDFGSTVLETHKDKTTVMVYAWDLQTNVRKTITFDIPHERDLKDGKKMALKSNRDIYEMIANQSQRRLRSCLLNIIPGYILEAALAQIEETRQKGSASIGDRVRKLVVAFGDIAVTKPMIEDHLGHKIEEVSDKELATLRGIYTGIKNGDMDREDVFSTTPIENKKPGKKVEDQSEDDGDLGPSKAAPKKKKTAKKPDPKAAPQQQGETKDDGKSDPVILLRDKCKEADIILEATEFMIQMGLLEDGQSFEDLSPVNAESILSNIDNFIASVTQ